MGFLERLRRQPSQQPITKQEDPSFSQADMRRALFTMAGNRFFNDLDHPSQARVSEVFAGQDAEGLRQLIGIYDATTVEGMAYALDNAVKGVIGLETSYHDWATGIMQGPKDQPQR